MCITSKFLTAYICKEQWAENSTDLLVAMPARVARRRQQSCGGERSWSDASFCDV